MIYGDPKFRTDDMPVAASFVSDKRGLFVQLIPRTTKPGPQGTEIVEDRTGCRIRFEEGEHSIKNSALFKLMVEDERFGLPTNGWTPNPLDPTGFWRMNGLIKTRAIQVVDESQPFGLPIGNKDSAERKAFAAKADPKLKHKKPEEVDKFLEDLGVIQDMRR